jgi:hypothetical protein
LILHSGTASAIGPELGVPEPRNRINAAPFVSRIAVGWQDDLALQLLAAHDRGVEIVDLKPEKKAVAIGPVERIGESPW